MYNSVGEDYLLILKPQNNATCSEKEGIVVRFTYLISHLRLFIIIYDIESVELKVILIIGMHSLGDGL